MRRPLSLVLVLLLILRGLLGDAMAMGAAPVPGAPSAHTAEAHHHAAQAVFTAAVQDSAHSAHALHHGSEAAPPSCADDGSSSSCASHEHGPSCTLCGICHSALFTPGELAPGSAFSSAGLRPQGSERFASAALLQATKPPIS